MNKNPFMDIAWKNKGMNELQMFQEGRKIMA